MNDPTPLQLLCKNMGRSRLTAMCDINRRWGRLAWHGTVYTLSLSDSPLILVVLFRLTNQVSGLIESKECTLFRVPKWSWRAEIGIPTYFWWKTCVPAAATCLRRWRRFISFSWLYHHYFPGKKILFGTFERTAGAERGRGKAASGTVSKSRLLSSVPFENTRPELVHYDQPRHGNELLEHVILNISQGF